MPLEWTPVTRKPVVIDVAALLPNGLVAGDITDVQAVLLPRGDKPTSTGGWSDTDYVSGVATTPPVAGYAADLTGDHLELPAEGRGLWIKYAWPQGGSEPDNVDVAYVDDITIP